MLRSPMLHLIVQNTLKTVILYIYIYIYIYIFVDLYIYCIFKVDLHRAADLLLWMHERFNNRATVVIKKCFNLNHDISLNVFCLFVFTN